MALHLTIERRAYPLPEVAALLGGLSLRTVYNHLGTGELRAIKIGGRRVVLAEDLEAFLATATAASQAPLAARAKPKPAA